MPIWKKVVTCLVEFHPPAPVGAVRFAPLTEHSAVIELVKQMPELERQREVCGLTSLVR